MYVSKDGCQLWVDSWGQAEGRRPVVFLHDFLMSSCAWAPQLFGKLQDKCRMYAFDFRGFGRSARSREDCSIGLLADDVGYVLEELGIYRPVIVGAGMGAAVAMLYAATSGQKVLSRVVLVSATPTLLRQGDFRWGMSRAAADRYVHLLRTDFPAVVSGYLNVTFPCGADQRIKNIVRSVAGEACPVAAASCLANLAENDFRPILSCIEAPVSVISGLSDRLAPVWAGAWLANTVRAERFFIIPSDGHAPYLTAPGKFNEALLAILSDPEASACPDLGMKVPHQQQSAVRMS